VVKLAMVCNPADRNRSRCRYRHRPRPGGNAERPIAKGVTGFAQLVGGGNRRMRSGSGSESLSGSLQRL